MSSAPAQFLIYVLPTPTCPIPPVIMPATDCFEILAGIPTDIQLLVVNNCNPTVADISDVIMSKTLSGLDMTDMAALPTNDSLILVEFNFTSQSNQIGPQTFCLFHLQTVQQPQQRQRRLQQPAQLRPHRRPPQQQRAQQHQRVRQPQAQQAQQLQQLQQLQARLLQRPRRQQQPQLQQPQLQRRQQPQLQRRQQPQLPRRQQPQLQRRQQLQQQLRKSR
ncbi:unnamed protein product [Rotaria socialis]|uniref:Uncharacterized protein n=1 Tax=Rotaria socialis TaxID=392032 RepID=A0A817R4C1_9BILA|nr:unnamed protein product [Rotaria socialis]